MKKLFTIGAIFSMLAAPAVSMAHTGTIVGAAIGGATGAVIGESMDSRDAIIIWSAIGGMAGAAIGHNMSERERAVVVVREAVPTRYIVRERPVYQRVYYVEEPDYWHRRKHRHHHDDD